MTRPSWRARPGRPAGVSALNAPRLLADVQRMVRMLDKDDVMAAVINEQGEAKWCVALRPVVEKYKDGLFEPVR
jgi:hypothetical protein